MGWFEKQKKKNEVEKLINQIMKSPEYKKRMKERERKECIEAMVRLGYIVCEYLEIKHRYGENGMKHFLKFFKQRIIDLGKDDAYFEDVFQYYKNNHKLDIYEYMGFPREELKTDEA